jgi:hypothetical protein
MPPYGNSAVVQVGWLINTIPVSMRLANRLPSATSRVKTEPPKPKSESLASATASSSFLTRKNSQPARRILSPNRFLLQSAQHYLTEHCAGVLQTADNQISGCYYGLKQTHPASKAKTGKGTLNHNTIKTTENPRNVFAITVSQKFHISISHLLWKRQSGYK